MSLRLQNKVAIVTGSSSGLGRAIAVRYAKEGAHVVCADLRPTARLPGLEDSEVETHEVIKQSGGKAIFTQMDVTSAKNWEEVVQSAVGEFGRLDMQVITQQTWICLNTDTPTQTSE